MKIKANQYISDGYSAEEAEKLLPKIEDAVKTKEPFEVDFEGVQFFTTLFFSSALTRFVGEVGIEEYNGLIKVSNLSESGKETYAHALDYAVEYYSKTREEQEMVQRITKEETEEV
jgi:hypothetical protein